MIMRRSFIFRSSVLVFGLFGHGLFQIKSCQLSVKSVDVRFRSLVAQLSECLALFGRLLPLFLVVVESAYFLLIAPRSITVDPLILVRVVETLNSRVTFITLKTFITFIPANTFNKGLTILRQILEKFRWPSEVSGVVCVDATFGIMGVFLIWAPTGFILEHVECEDLNVLVLFL